MPSTQIRKLSKERLVEGRLEVNPSGFGFVVADDADARERQDIYVAAANLTEAMHGDRVVARVERETPRGLEGRIAQILLWRGDGEVFVTVKKE